MVTLSDANQISRLENEIENDDVDEESIYDNSSTSSESEEESGTVLSAEDVAKSKPSFGSITVTNSSDVHFGNKTFYQGPVTIKQFVYAKDGQKDSLCDNSEISGALRDKRLILDCSEVSGEKYNHGYDPDEDGVSNGRPYNVQNGGTVGKINEQSKLGRKWISGLSKQHVILIGALGTAFLVSLIILIVILTVKHSPLGDNKDKDAYNVTLPDKVRIVSRLQWVAQPPVEPLTDLETPVKYVIIWHTATENCSDQATCVFHVRFIQTFHIESRHWWDIAYNFLVGGDGNAYEGRGWNKEGSHTFAYNKYSIGIAFIGTFITIKPPEWQINACKMLIKMGVEQGYIAKDYKLLAAKQLQGTQSPGAALYEDIKTWPHWSAQP